MIKADKPTTANNLQYHTHTGEDDIAPLCLIVGAPGRADMIAEKYLISSKRFSNDKRGLVSCTGYYKGVRVSVTTSGMGGASTGIILPEVAKSGARVIIRVGTCGSMIEKSKPGDSIIVTSAIRYDGASENWAPIPFPANADYRVVYALVEAAKKIAPDTHHVGEECTTSCFYAGQGRPNIYGEIPYWMSERHEQVMKMGTACYSMEAATLFTWGKYEARGIPTGAINAVVANRHTNEFAVEGEEQAALIALEALVWLSTDPDTLATIKKIEIPY